MKYFDGKEQIKFNIIHPNDVNFFLLANPHCKTNLKMSYDKRH